MTRSNENNNNSNGNSNSNKVLNYFLVDFQERIFPATDPQQSLSLSQCLRRVCRKQRPLPVVQRLLLLLLEPPDSELGMEVIKTAFRILQTDYLEPLSTIIPSSSSMHYIQQISVVLAFVQLLLEKPFQPPQTTITTITAAAAVTALNECHTMTMALLQGITKALSTLLQSNNKNNAATTTTATATTNDNIEPFIRRDQLEVTVVGAFLITALLRQINPYVLSTPILLSPLWKGICDVISQHKNISHELAKETMMVLASYLQEGERQCTLSLLNYHTQQKSTLVALSSSTLPRHNTKQHLFHIKILSFLLARLTVLLPVYLTTLPASDDDSLMLQQLCTSMCSIRGLGMSLLAHTHTSILQQQPPDKDDQTIKLQYQQLEQKMEQCLQQSMCCNDSVVTQLLLLPIPAIVDGELPSLALGKLITWHQFFESRHSADPEQQLQVCQDMIFSTIPHCFECFMTPFETFPSKQQFTSLLAVSIRYISTILIQTDLSALHKTISLSRQQLYGIILKWLSPSTRLHPASREVLLSSIHQACRGSLTRQDSPRAVEMELPDEYPMTPFLGTLTSVLFDPRTQQFHRANVASLLVRILTSIGLTGTSYQIVVQAVVTNEFTARFKHHVVTKKRKRDVMTIKSADFYNFGQLHVEDINTICSVLRCVQVCGNSYLQEMLEVMNQDLQEHVSQGTFWIGLRQPVEVALLLAYLTGLYIGASSGRRNICETSNGDAKLDFISESKSKHFLLLMSEWFVQHTKRRKTGALSRGIINAVLSTLCLLRSGLVYAGGRSTPQELVNSIANSLTMSSQIVGNLLCDNQRYGILVVLEVIGVLGAIGSVIHSNCSNEIVKSFAATFKNIFLLNLWPIASEGMTELTLFASTLPSAHQCILPKCFPLEMQTFLKARLQGEVYQKAASHKVMDSTLVHHACSKILNLLLPTLPIPLLPATTAVHQIEPGSYFLAMPTTQGRTALVIFAPGKQSVQDIKDMLGTDSIEDAGIQTLTRVQVLSPDTNGCRLFSKSWK